VAEEIANECGETFAAPDATFGTLADLLNGVEVKMPPHALTFKQAQKVKPDKPIQPELF
jgi:hypothetical protein